MGTSRCESRGPLLWRPLLPATPSPRPQTSWSGRWDSVQVQILTLHCAFEPLGPADSQFSRSGMRLGGSASLQAPNQVRPFCSPGFWPDEKQPLHISLLSWLSKKIEIKQLIGHLAGSKPPGVLTFMASLNPYRNPGKGVPLLLRVGREQPL